MNMYVHRTCVCGRTFRTDSNEYQCSAECEDYVCNQEIEIEEENNYLDSLDHGEEETG